MSFNKENRAASDVLGHYELVNKLQKVVIGCLIAFIVILIGICAYLGTLPKSVPWVIELTQDGQATYYPDAVKLLDQWSPNETTQRYFMMDYVINLRSVSTDNYINKDRAQQVFNKTINQATSQVTKWYEANNPIDISADMYIQVPEEEISIVQYSPTQYQVTWRETGYRRTDHAILTDNQYQGIFNIAFYTPDTERARRNNPIGMYVTSFDIALLRNLL